MALRCDTNRQAGPGAARFLGVVLFLCVAASGAVAQHVVGLRAGIIQHVRGEALLDGTKIELPQTTYVQAEPGQELSTTMGLVELLLGPEAVLRMGIFGLLRITENRLDDTRLELEQGSALVEVTREIEGNRIGVRFGNAEVEIVRKGLYRLDAGAGEIRVYGGQATVSIGSRRVKVKEGRMLSLNGDRKAKKFDAGGGADSLHKWAARRSFDLYQVMSRANPQSHWKPLSLGWAVNSDYRVRLFSDRLLREWLTVQHVPLEVKMAMEQEQRKQQAAREYLEQKAIRDRKELEEAQRLGLRNAP